MGNFYTNITIKGPSRDDVCTALERWNLSAVVAPMVAWFTVLSEAQSDNQDIDALRVVASRLSGDLKAPALAAVNHDDDVLALFLYVDGQLIDEYCSSPEYPDRSASGPAGGDPSKYDGAFSGVDLVALDAAFRAPPVGDHATVVFELQRHQAIAAALGMPSFTAGFGYTYAVNGELSGLTPDEIISVGDAADVTLGKLVAILDDLNQAVANPKAGYVAEVDYSCPPLPARELIRLLDRFGRPRNPRVAAAVSFMLAQRQRCDDEALLPRIVAFARNVSLPQAVCNCFTAIIRSNAKLTKPLLRKMAPVLRKCFTSRGRDSWLLLFSAMQFIEYADGLDGSLADLSRVQCTWLASALRNQRVMDPESDQRSREFVEGFLLRREIVLKSRAIDVLDELQIRRSKLPSGVERKAFEAMRELASGEDGLWLVFERYIVPRYAPLIRPFVRLCKEYGARKPRVIVDVLASLIDHRIDDLGAVEGAECLATLAKCARGSRSSRTSERLPTAIYHLIVRLYDVSARSKSRMAAILDKLVECGILDRLGSAAQAELSRFTLQTVSDSKAKHRPDRSRIQEWAR